MASIVLSFQLFCILKKFNIIKILTKKQNWKNIIYTVSKKCCHFIYVIFIYSFM